MFEIYPEDVAVGNYATGRNQDGEWMDGQVTDVTDQAITIQGASQTVTVTREDAGDWTWFVKA